MGAEAAEPWQGDVVAIGFDPDRAGGEAAGVAATALALVTRESHRGALAAAMFGGGPVRERVGSNAKR
jgi:hypothetical protein